MDKTTSAAIKKEITALGVDIERQERSYDKRIALVIVAAMLVCIVACTIIGRYECTRADILLSLAHGTLGGIIQILELPALLIPNLNYSIVNPIAVTWTANVDLVVWTVRIPRIIGVIFIGGGLSIAGACYQSLFRNPLVSDSILGVSSGAGFGAVLAMLLELSTVLVNVFAFIGGILAVGLTYFASKAIKGNQTLLLVLAGMVVSSVFSAGISIVKYIAPQDTKLPEIVFWLMGSFAKITAQGLYLLVPIVIICTLVLMRIRWKMNVLALGEDDARSLGVNVHRTQLLIIICSTLISSIAVCICGMISWVGMIIPQVTRMVIGPDTRRLLPCAFFVGAIFLMIVDAVCRALLAIEIPASIVTSLVGAPIFLLALKSAKEGWA